MNLDVAALIVATVALVASVISVGWQVYTWWRTRALDVRIELSQLWETKDIDEDTSTDEHYLTVKVTNRSDFSIRLVSVALIPSGDHVHSWWAGDPLGLPLVVKPRDGETIRIPVHMYAGGLFDSTLQACVELATGEELRSLPTQLYERTYDD